MNTAEIQLVQEFDMAVHVGGVSLAVLDLEFRYSPNQGEAVF